MIKNKKIKNILLTVIYLFTVLTIFNVNPVFAQNTIKAFRVEGNKRVESATVVSYLGLQAGDPFDQGLIDKALKNLYRTGLFSDVSLFQQGSTLLVKISEKPIINEIRFEGNDKIKNDSIESEIRLKPRQVLTRTKVQNATSRIQEMYRAGGYFAAVIEPKIIKLDQNRVNLVFEITEGKPTLIARISFIGNKHYSDSVLEKIIRSKEDHWYRFWVSDDKYDPDRLAYDKELMRKFYMEHGYVDFRIEAAVAELSQDHQDFFITFSIYEGERYKVGDINIKTTIPDLDPELLRKNITLEKGEWYNTKDIETSISNMTAKLGNLQFAFVEIRPGVKRDKKGHIVNVDFIISEGKKAFINDINISGNSRTLDRVIRREMTLIEGDPFNRNKINKSEQKIKNLGFFGKVSVNPQKSSSPDKIDINVDVEEKSTGEMSIGAGFSTTDGPLADFKISERNFLGKGQNLSFSTSIAQKRTSFDLSFTEPYFLKRDLSAGVDLFHTTTNLQTQSSFDSKTSGGRLRLGYPLAEDWRQNLTYEYKQSDINNVQSNASIFIRQQAGKNTKSTVSQILSYDTRDSRINPTEGTISQLFVDIAGLGGNTKFYKAKITGTYYYPIIDKWIFSLLGEAGYIKGFGGKNVRIDERYILGGDRFRGFADSGVGPRDSVSDDALGGNRFWRSSAQVTFPSGLPEALGVRGFVFSDFGALWSVDDTGATIQDASTMRISAGGGIAWRSPFGPIRISLAKPIKKTSFDNIQEFRLSFGTRF